MALPRMLAALIVTTTLALPSAANDRIQVELNKLDPAADACNLSLVIGNPTKTTYKDYALDLIVFDSEGVIARRLALDVAPVRASRTSVYTFSVAGLACERFGKLLLNGVKGCGTDTDDCAAGVDVKSLAKIPFIK